MNKYFLMILVVGFSCVQKGNSEEQDDSAASNTETVKPHDAKVKIFNNIDSMRYLLSQVGIGDLGRWRSDEMGGFMSITSYHSFGESGLNNLAYYLESDNANYVTTLKLVLNINSRGERRKALNKLTEVTEKTFLALGLTVPAELIQSIGNEKPVIIESSDFTSELALEKSKIDSWVVRITTKKQEGI